MRQQHRRRRGMAILLVAALCLGLCACSGDGGDSSAPTKTTTVAGLTLSSVPTKPQGTSDTDWAFDLYETSVEKRREYKGIDATLTGSATVKNNTGETEWTFDITWRSQQDSKDVAGYVDHLTETVTKNGEQTSCELHYGDGVLYYKDKDRKYRRVMARNTAIGEVGLFRMSAMTKAAFRSPIMAYEDNKTVLSLPMNGDILSDELLAADGALAYLLGGIDDTVDYTFGDTTVKLIFDADSCLVGYGVYYTVTANDEANTSASVLLETTYNVKHKDITVKLPSKDDYTEHIGSGLSVKAYEAMTVIVDALYDANGERVDGFDAKFAELSETYGTEIVHDVVVWFEEQ